MAKSIDVVRSFYGALAAGDVSRVESLLAERIEWTEAERFPYFGGTWHTPRQVIDQLLTPLASEWVGFAATPAHFVAAGHDVVAFGRYTGQCKATERHMDAPFAHWWTVRDGLIVHFRQYTDTAKVLEALHA